MASIYGNCFKTSGLMRTAAITGGIGDIVYAIPTMHALKITTLYVKENFYPDGTSMYSVSKPLLAKQGIEALPTSGAYPFDMYEPGIPYNYNLDEWRRSPNRGRDHIMLSMGMYWKCLQRNWRLPWLRNIPVSNGGYNLVFLTWRWRDNSPVDWSVVRSLIPEPYYFIGIEEDHTGFEAKHGAIEWHPTPDLLEMAHLIANCNALYCNQGVALTLAQGLGKTYWLEQKPGKTNCLLRTPNEHLINTFFAQ